MAGLINLRLLTDFFNKIGPLRQFAAMHFGGKADSRVWFARANL